MSSIAILLMGPTASGKSALALELAQRLPAEIVSVDSAQVYRGMDIGTAKPTPVERSRVAHHLIDIVDPTERYSAARFADDARRAIAGIAARGRMPLLVGGTMLYFRALTQGLSALPGADPAVRAAIDARAAAEGWPAMHRRLAAVDAATAARLDPQDRQRIQRALEVYELSGRPLSDWLRADVDAGDGGPHPSATPSASSAGHNGDSHRDDERRSAERYLRIALIPSERAILHQRIADRFRTMVDTGLVDEVRALRARYPLTPEMPSMRAVGYRQAWQHLDGAFDRPMLVERGIFATRQLAKRQLTWLRATPAHVFDPLVPGFAADVAQTIARAFAAR